VDSDIFYILHYYYYCYYCVELHILFAVTICLRGTALFLVKVMGQFTRPLVCGIETHQCSYSLSCISLMALIVFEPLLETINSTFSESIANSPIDQQRVTFLLSRCTKIVIEFLL